MISIVGWRGPDEGDIKLPPPPPPPPPPPSDLGNMRSALAFAAKLLRDEMGPGGLVEREPDAVRVTWILAIDCLEAAGAVPMIPLYFWRRRACGHCDGAGGTHTVRGCAGAR